MLLTVGLFSNGFGQTKGEFGWFPTAVQGVADSANYMATMVVSLNETPKEEVFIGWEGSYFKVPFSAEGGLVAGSVEGKQITLRFELPRKQLPEVTITVGSHPVQLVRTTKPVLAHGGTALVLGSAEPTLTSDGIWTVIPWEGNTRVAKRVFDLSPAKADVLLREFGLQEGDCLDISLIANPDVRAWWSQRVNKGRESPFTFWLQLVGLLGVQGSKGSMVRLDSSFWELFKRSGETPTFVASWLLPLSAIVGSPISNWAVGPDFEQERIFKEQQLKVWGVAETTWADYWLSLTEESLRLSSAMPLNTIKKDKVAVTSLWRREEADTAYFWVDGADAPQETVVSLNLSGQRFTEAAVTLPKLLRVGR